MYKIEYEINKDNNGDLIVRLSDDYEDIPQHKLLFFIMSGHLLNTVKQINENINENEMLRIENAINLLTEVAYEINTSIINDKNDTDDTDDNIKGFVVNSVKTLKELRNFKLNSTYDKENNLKVKNGTTFYCIRNKKKYFFNKEKKLWVEYENNN